MNETTYRLTNPGKTGKTALAVGLLGLALSFAGYAQDAAQFYFSYLTAYVFWVTIALGGLFFTMLHHLTSSTWSVVLRRIAESLMVSLPLFILLFIPVWLGMHDLYHWTHGDAVARDAALQGKAGYLNIPFFTLRTAGYFFIWVVLGWLLYRKSISQDKAFNAGDVVFMRRLSAPGMILFALTLSFASFDWLMSLDPHWYSTIFGVYIFGGSTLSVISFITLICLYLRRGGVLADTVTVEHYHDLGRLMLTFTIFWAYIAFSQYFLIWYANMPEETEWFLQRWEGSWSTLSLIVAFAWVVPFLTMLLRAPKRNMAVLGFMSVYLLVFHWVDMYWLVMPALHGDGVHVSWMDVTTLCGVGGLFVWFFWLRLTSRALVPVNDPRLEKSITIAN